MLRGTANFLRSSVQIFGCSIVCVCLLDIGKSNGQSASDEINAGAFLKAVESRLIETAESSSASVVSIACVPKQPDARVQTLQLLQRDNAAPFQVARPTTRDYVADGYATGIVWDNDGTIVTTYHSLGDPETHDYFVWSNEKPLLTKTFSITGTKVVANSFTNIAILKVDGQGLSPLSRLSLTEESSRGDRGSLVKQGQFVFCVGDPDGIARHGDSSVGIGVVSAVLRGTMNLAEQGLPADSNAQSIEQYESLFEVDSNLLTRTSGGAVIDLEGQWIGMSTTVAAVQGRPQGVALAIPVDELFARTVESLLQGQQPEFGFLGIQPEDLPDRQRRDGVFGVRVLSAVNGMPAQFAGIRDGDLIVSVDGKLVRHKNDLFRYLSRLAPGATVKISIERTAVGSNQKENLVLKVSLSKRHVVGFRPIYPEPRSWYWRGMAVEYATALEPELLRIPSRFSSEVQQLGLAVVAVQPASSAWRAGVRPGHVLVKMAGEPIKTPSEFRELAEQQGDREVSLRLWSTGRDGFDVKIGMDSESWNGS